jgi:hypothetical protein
VFVLFVFRCAVNKACMGQGCQNRFGGTCFVRVLAAVVISFFSVSASVFTCVCYS